jgi:hypothetical protein
VTLSNQFQDRTVKLLKPMHYCNAVDKNGEGIDNPASHLTCYKAQKAVKIKPQVRTADQFGPQALSVQKQTTRVCVPTEQFELPTPTPTPMPSVTPTPTPATSDNFDLYKAKTTPGTPSFKRRKVYLVDQWIDEDVTLTKPVRLGVPTSVDNGGISDPSSQLTCYLVKKASNFKNRDVAIRNQFGGFMLTVRKPNMLCVPSTQPLPNGDG